MDDSLWESFNEAVSSSWMLYLDACWWWLVVSIERKSPETKQTNNAADYNIWEMVWFLAEITSLGLVEIHKT